ncbi:MAG: right-handed parallel beta-helix repeat-containing protein, partial [Planctomycetaceae bacterium]|nr:right-handed parallel beta-helix repeat-containing protein [Planctomycetaceae bacterium]
YEGHNATISGGKRITGFAPTGNNDGCVVADIPEVKAGKWSFRDLYVNNIRAIRARFPNNDFLRVNKAGEDRRTNFFFKPNELKPVDDLDQVELVFLHDWSITRTPIKSIDTSENKLTVPLQIGGDLPLWNIDTFEPHARYFLENSRAYLDIAGEWFLDKKEGKLYYKLREGETADNIDVIAPVVSQLVIVEGTETRHVTNLHFCNLKFEYTAFNEKLERTYWGRQAATYCEPILRDAPNDKGKMFDYNSVNATPAAIQWDFASNCTMDECTFRHLGENGFWIGKACYANLVLNCFFDDIGANAVMFGTHNNNHTARCNVISFSKITRPAQTLYGGVGIWIGLTENSTVDRCEVSSTPYTGVSVGWSWNDKPTAAKENMVLGCHLYNCMLLLSDGGAIYTLGRQPNSRLAFNNIHDIPRNIGRAESNGMFLDEGTTDFKVDFNLIVDTFQSPLRFHRAGKNLVENNFFSLNNEKSKIVTYNNTPKENITLQQNKTDTKEKITEQFQNTIKTKIFDYRTR